LVLLPESRKRFLLVACSNKGYIVHSFGDVVAQRPQNQNR